MFEIRECNIGGTEKAEDILKQRELEDNSSKKLGCEEKVRW